MVKCKNGWLPDQIVETVLKDLNTSKVNFRSNDSTLLPRNSIESETLEYLKVNWNSLPVNIR